MRTLITSLLLISAQLVVAQQPITWQFQAVKTGELQYDVVLKATIQPGWHLYSQQQPDDAIAIPTSIHFNANPLLVREKGIREDGKLEKFKDKTLGVTSFQFSNQVSFIQSIKLKAKVKTAITGEVEYQVCDDEKCLPPKKQSFTIALNG